MKRINLGDPDHRQVQEAPDPDHDLLADQELVRGQAHVHQPKIGLHGPDQNQDHVHQPKIGKLHGPDQNQDRVHQPKIGLLDPDQNQPLGRGHDQDRNQARGQDPVRVPDQVRQRVHVLQVHQVQTKAE